MTEMGDMYREMRKRRQQRRHDWGERRLKGFAEAQQLACGYGMRLIERRYKIHYQLIVHKEDGGVLWRYDLYPTTGRIVSQWIKDGPDQKRRGPYLACRKAWMFSDVVEAAALGVAAVEQMKGLPK